MAQAQGRAELVSAMTDELGMFEWTEYDNVNHRALEKAADEVVSTATPNKPSNTTFAPRVKGESAAAVERAVATPDRVYRDDYPRLS